MLTLITASGDVDTFEDVESTSQMMQAPSQGKEKKRPRTRKHEMEHSTVGVAVLVATSAVASFASLLGFGSGS